MISRTGVVEECTGNDVVEEYTKRADFSDITGEDEAAMAAKIKGGEEEDEDEQWAHRMQPRLPDGGDEDDEDGDDDGDGEDDDGHGEDEDDNDGDNEDGEDGVDGVAYERVLNPVSVVSGQIVGRDEKRSSGPEFPHPVLVHF